MNNITHSNEINKNTTIYNYSLNEEIINLSNEPLKSEYYRTMFNKMLEQIKDDDKEIKNTTTFLNKCTE